MALADRLLAIASVLATPGWGAAIAASASALAAWLSWRTNRSQLLLARQRRRDDLYERRFAIYRAFHTLIEKVAAGRYEAGNLPALYSALADSRAALAHGPFLLSADLTTFLLDLQHLSEIEVSTLRDLPQLKNAMDRQEYGRKVEEERAEAQSIINSHERLVSLFRPLLELARKD